VILRLSIVWFRLDLRLADNPALNAAVKRGGPVIPVFIWAPEEEGKWSPGAASRWWLHQSLLALDASLRAIGSRLVIRRGPTIDTLRAVMKETGADTVFWNRRYEPSLVERDRRIRATVPGGDFNSALLFEPGDVMNAAGKPFRVFTPFWRACMSQDVKTTLLPRPKTLPAPSRWPRSLSLDELGLEPEIDWAKTIRRPGNPARRERINF